MKKYETTLTLTMLRPDSRNDGTMMVSKVLPIKHLRYATGLGLIQAARRRLFAINCKTEADMYLDYLNDWPYTHQPQRGRIDWIYQDDGFGNAVETAYEACSVVVEFLREDLH